MPQTPREIVTRTLNFEYPERLARQTWALPWAHKHHGTELAALLQRFPDDIAYPPSVYLPSSRAQGDRYALGNCIDEWGCRFLNIQEGVIGEVRDPLLKDLADWQSVEPPYDTLPTDIAAARDTVNRACAETDRFVFGGCCPRPWERYQFIRGTVNAMMDVASNEPEFHSLLARIHDFHMRELEFWVTTDVDAIMFMDDWGAQSQLLISPKAWREHFKPLYRDYCDIAHANRKFVFMHSDGCIEAVYPDIVEVGVNAVNSQLFTMNMDNLARIAKGKLTFWGEIDRQHVLTSKDPDVGRAAVREVARHLYDPSGGVIAQFEFGLGAQPPTAMAVFEEWDKVHQEGLQRK